MNFHRRNRSFFNTYPLARTVVLISLVLVVVLGIDTVTNGAVRGAVRAPLSMIALTENETAAAVSGTIGTANGNACAIEYVRSLEELRDNAVYTQLTNALLRAENRALLAQLALVSVSQDDIPVVAKSIHRVLASGGVYPYGTLVISKPAEYHFNVGDLVYAGGSVVIGTVESVDNNALLVRLFAAPARKTTAILHTENDTVVVDLNGVSGGNFTTQVPRDTDVAEGAVVTLRENTHALIGTVGSIESTAADAFKTVRISVPVRVDTLEYVFVAYGS